MLRLLSQRLFPGLSARESLIWRIETLTEIQEIRKAWQLLEELALLDVTGNDGGAWLIGAADALEPVYLALLSRTRSLVDDEISAKRRRPEYLRDLRERVDRADQHGGGVAQRVVLRRMIVRNNLFVVADDNRSAREIRRTLARYAGLGLRPSLYLDSNVATKAAPDGRCGRATRLTGVLPDAPDERIAGSRSHELERMTLSIAWRLARARRGSEMEKHVHDSAAAHAMERRRRRLIASCGSAMQADATRRDSLLFPWLEREKFDLSRRGVVP